MPSSLRDKATIPPAWAQDWAKVLGTVELPAGLQAPRHSAHAKNTPKTHHRALKTSFGINLTILVNYMVLLLYRQAGLPSGKKPPPSADRRTP
jgi:hypothetical protein